MENKLDILGKINAVETPAFLFTRIQNKIQQHISDRISKKQAVAYICGIVVIIVLNVLAFRAKKNAEDDNDLVSRMNLSPSNQIY